VLVPMLEKAPQLEPQTLLLHLKQTFPGQEWFRRKRTLQRRVEGRDPLLDRHVGEQGAAALLVASHLGWAAAPFSRRLGFSANS